MDMTKDLFRAKLAKGGDLILSVEDIGHFITEHEDGKDFLVLYARGGPSFYLMSTADEVFSSLSKLASKANSQKEA